MKCFRTTPPGQPHLSTTSTYQFSRHSIDASTPILFIETPQRYRRLQIPTTPAAVLSSSYPAKILTIAENGQCGTLHELRPHCKTLADISAASLVAAIRTAIGPSESKPNLQ
jgi:hypothetical protein